MALVSGKAKQNTTSLIKPSSPLPSCLSWVAPAEIQTDPARLPIYPLQLAARQERGTSSWAQAALAVPSPGGDLVPTLLLRLPLRERLTPLEAWVSADARGLCWDDPDEGTQRGWSTGSEGRGRYRVGHS